jgi:hypothetical protein
VYDTLLFLHVLAAFALMVTAVTYSAVAIGAPTELGRRAKEGYAPAKPLAEGGAVAVAERASLMHWLRTLAVIGLLVLMIWKPGA